MQVGHIPKLCLVIIYIGYLSAINSQYWNVEFVGNHGLLCFHALDLIGCMHWSLGISKSITIEKMAIKPLLTIDLEIWTPYLDLDVPRSIPCNEEHVWIVWRSHIHKIFHPMTWTTIMVLQSVVFVKVETLTLSFSLSLYEGWSVYPPFCTLSTHDTKCMPLLFSWFVVIP